MLPIASRLCVSNLRQNPHCRWAEYRAIIGQKSRIWLIKIKSKLLRTLWNANYRYFQILLPISWHQSLCCRVKSCSGIRSRYEGVEDKKLRSSVNLRSEPIIIPGWIGTCRQWSRSDWRRKQWLTNYTNYNFIFSF